MRVCVVSVGCIACILGLAVRELHAQPVEEIVIEDAENIDAGDPAWSAEELPDTNVKTREYRMVLPNGPINVQAYYSDSLRAWFVVRRFRRGNVEFPGARLVSDPEYASPLEVIPIRRGDIITRLDDIRVRTVWELERHYAETSVRWVQRNTGNVRIGMIYINASGLNP